MIYIYIYGPYKSIYGYGSYIILMVNMVSIWAILALVAPETGDGFTFYKLSGMLDPAVLWLHGTKNQGSICRFPWGYPKSWMVYI